MLGEDPAHLATGYLLTLCGLLQRPLCPQALPEGRVLHLLERLHGEVDGDRLQESGNGSNTTNL